jgi:hypothetical protein
LFRLNCEARVLLTGPGTVLSANDFIESDDAEGFPGSWGADLSSKRQ